MSKDGILHTKSECEILEHNMNTQNCNSKGNTTYKILIRIPRPILNIYNLTTISFQWRLIINTKLDSIVRVKL